MSDLSDLGPGPDITAIDVDKLDFGNDTASPEPRATAPEPEPQAAEPEEKAVEPAPEEKAAEPEEPSRDEKGRFTGKGAIPIERHKELFGKEREAREAAERRAAELERQLSERQEAQSRVATQAQFENQIELMEQKHAELLLDGNTKEASQLMRNIRALERQMAATEAEQRAVAATAQVLESERATAVIARLEADFPALNPQSDDYDQDVVDLVLAKQQTLIRQGMTPSAAIDKAARDVAARFLVKAPEPKAEPKGLDTTRTAEERRKQSVEQALTAQRQQPASMRESGMDSDKMGEKGLPDVSRMSADEFDALPQATKDRLMGNLV